MFYVKSCDGEVLNMPILKISSCNRGLALQGPLYTSTIVHHNFKHVLFTMQVTPILTTKQFNSLMSIAISERVLQFVSQLSRTYIILSYIYIFHAIKIRD
jgi:hypothetical protein